MQEWAQWWLVITSPLGETKLAEQPPAMRADESRTWSSHASLTWTPYFCLICSRGGWLKVHMPSSARAVAETVERQERAARSSTARFMAVVIAAVAHRVKSPRRGPSCFVLNSSHAHSHRASRPARRPRGN